MSMTVCTSVRALPPGYCLAECGVSGGLFTDYLRAVLEAAEGRLCLRLSPIRMEFPLPCPTGQGRALSEAELVRLRGDAPCYFSDALCTEYFTLLRQGAAWTVLFDTERSLREKLRRAEACGVPMALVEDPALRRLLG